MGLYVSTTGARFHVEAYRLGYYQGLGARLVWRSPDVPGKLQAHPVVDPATNMVEARWKPSLRFQVGPDWTQGVYLLKIVANNGAQRDIPLTVRDDSSHAALVIQNSVTTWQAYNHWGGYSLYDGPDGGFEDRSRVVSFDRPYDSLGDFLSYEQPVIVLAEKLGLDVTYWTDVDLHERGNLLLNHHAVISLGHDEYWSIEMRHSLLSGRRGGVNIAFLGGNADFRHIRFARSPLGPDRREIDYKRAPEDPLYGVNNSQVTGWSWREEPVRRPESVINGDLYQCNPVRADMIIFDASSWIFRGTGLRNGSHLPNLVGNEYDRVDAYFPTPETIQVIAHSPVVCRGQHDYSDAIYYSTRSGAGVFDSGTTGWVAALMCEAPIKHRSCDRRVVRITTNILEAMSVGPAGRMHPSRPNLTKLGIRLAEPLDV